MMRQLALFLGRHAARVIDPIRPGQAAAMYAEIESLEEREALRWAVGCLAASYRQRASLTAIAVVTTRLCVAAAASFFGLVHVLIGSTNLWLKVMLVNGQSLAGVTRPHLEGLEALPLDYWLGHCATLSLVGALHVFAALTMAAGRNDRLQQIALIIIGADVLLAIVQSSGLTLPLIYAFLIMLMAATSSILASIWRWDEHRLARAL